MSDDVDRTGIDGTYAVPSAGASGRAPRASISRHLPDTGLGFVAGLDGYRALAIVLVIMLHTMRVPSAESVMAIGWIGVNLFFVLSGFLITSVLLEAKGGTHYFRNFYARRALRILPLYYAALVAVFFVLPHLAARSSAIYWRTPLSVQEWFWGYLQNAPDRPSSRATNVMLFHFWSLAIEEQFYVVWPGIVLALSARTLGRLCVGFMIASPLLRLVGTLAGVEPVTIYMFTPFRIDGLAAGAWLAVRYRERGVSDLAPYATPAILGAALVLVVGRLTDPFSPVAQIIGYSLVILAGVSCIVSILTDGAANSFFSLAPMQAVGKVSYAMYVFHVPLIVLLESQVWLRPVTGGGQILYTVACVATTYALAVGSWYLFERPLLGLKRYFPYRRSATAAGR